MPEQIAIYAILTGAAADKSSKETNGWKAKAAMLAKYYGADALDRSLAGNVNKALQYNKGDVATASGVMSANVLPLFNNVQTVGQVIGSGISYYDLFKKETDDQIKDNKVASFDNAMFRAFNDKTLKLDSEVDGEIDTRDIKDANWWYKAASGYLSSLATYNTLRYMDAAIEDK
jgi:hypothetical protein